MQLICRLPQMVLGLALLYTGSAHLTTNRTEFQAQVPTIFKPWADQVVLASGVVELVLGFSLIFLWNFRAQIGAATALFFIAIFWGNISQYLNHIDAFGLNSDRARLLRLFFQPLLVFWAIASTGAWQSYKLQRSK